MMVFGSGSYSLGTGRQKAPNLGTALISFGAWDLPRRVEALLQEEDEE